MGAIAHYPTLHTKNLRILREAAADPISPMHDEAVQALLRFEEFKDGGEDPEIALDRAIRMGQVVDDTAGA